jgi:hypothetical protein
MPAERVNLPRPLFDGRGVFKEFDSNVGIFIATGFPLPLLVGVTAPMREKGGGKNDDVRLYVCCVF